MPHKFKVGDRVTMVNDFGVEFPGKVILSAETTTYGLAYKIKPTDSPWYAVPERNLRRDSDGTRSAETLAAPVPQDCQARAGSIAQKV